MQAFQTQATQVVCCPNCGSPAERYYFQNQNLSVQRSGSQPRSQQCIQTQCQQCDYLMVTCAQTGSVIEAYAPGIPFVAHSVANTIETLATAHKPHSLLNL